MYLVRRFGVSPQDVGTIKETHAMDVDFNTSKETHAMDVDLQHIKGQEHANQALEVCVAGGHGLRLIGPPGSGKTLLAHAAVSLHG